MGSLGHPLPVLQQLIGYPLTRGMLCAMRRRGLPEAAALCRDMRRVAVLENVMNPRVDSLNVTAFTHP